MSVSGISVLERGVRRGAHRVTVGLLASALNLPAADRSRLELAAGSQPGPRRRTETALDVPLERHNLPLALSSFRGRKSESDALMAQLAEHRLVTLTGTGGVGKTRLALETARRLVDRFPDGVWLVELAPLAEPELVAARVASALGATERFESVAGDAWMHDLARRRLLLVIDNCEHVLAASATFAQHLLERCPDVRILATSREAMRIPAERVVRIDPLEVPVRSGAPLSPAELQRLPGVSLFLDRARDVAPNFTIEPDDASAWQALQTICARLDGMPLALELAAARMNALRIEMLAQALDTTLLGVGGARTAPPRQQTLRALLDWSYELLSEDERHVLTRLAVFAGGFTWEAADAVCADANFPDERIVAILTWLVNKSLIAVDVTSPAARYSMLETTRAYARERLIESGQFDVAARSHAEYYRASLTRANAAYAEPSVALWLAPLAAEVDNYRAALRWAFGDRGDIGLGADIAAAQTSVLDLLSFVPEAIAWCESALAALGPLPAARFEAPLQLALAELYIDAGYYARIVPTATRAVELYRALEEPRTIRNIGNRAALAFALAAAAYSLMFLERYDEADRAASEAVLIAREERQTQALALVIKSRTIDPRDLLTRRVLLAEALAVSQSAADAPTLGLVLIFSSMAEYDAGNYLVARAYARDAVDYYRQNGIRAHFIVSALCLSALSALAAGEIDEAYADARAALEHGHAGLYSVRGAVRVIARVAALRGQETNAARLLGGSDALSAELGSVGLSYDDPLRDGTLAPLRVALSEDALAALIAEGRRWSIEEITVAALAV